MSSMKGVKHQLNAVGPGRSLPMFYQEINAHNETGANVRGQMWMDDYHGMFARFHSYGIGILAGWAIKECRRIKWSITLPANYFLCCIGKWWSAKLKILFKIFRLVGCIWLVICVILWRANLAQTSFEWHEI